MPILCVWIEEGCIACGACPITAPTVFMIPDGDGYDEAVICGSARIDGVQGSNREERSLLRPHFVRDYQDEIAEAAEGCPVEVIHFRVE